MAEMFNKFDDEDEDTQRGRYLTFLLGKEIYGLEIKFVSEIIGMQPITVVPEVPSYVKGITNLRGKIIPVVDMRLKFKKAPIEYNDRTCIIVVDIQDIAIGLIVDTVSEVLTIKEENIVDPPEYITGSQNRYIKGIANTSNEVKLLLDCDKLIGDDDIDLVEKII